MYSTVDRTTMAKTYGLSLRCILNFTPIISTPQALSSTSIRWNFTDTASTETGFKLYDSSNNLLATSTNANATYIDETNLTPNTQYTGRYINGRYPFFRHSVSQ